MTDKNEIRQIEEQYANPDLVISQNQVALTRATNRDDIVSADSHMSIIKNSKALPIRTQTEEEIYRWDVTGYPTATSKTYTVKNQGYLSNQTIKGSCIGASVGFTGTSASIGFTPTQSKYMSEMAPNVKVYTSLKK